MSRVDAGDQRFTNRMACAKWYSPDEIPVYAAPVADTDSVSSSDSSVAPTRYFKS
jgi:hypothetical protein